MDKSINKELIGVYKIEEAFIEKYSLNSKLPKYKRQQNDVREKC